MSINIVTEVTDSLEPELPGDYSDIKITEINRKTDAFLLLGRKDIMVHIHIFSFTFSHFIYHQYLCKRL